MGLRGGIYASKASKGHNVNMENDELGFPDVRWGSPDSKMAQLGHRAAATKAGAALIRSVVPLDRWLLTKSKGRYTALGPLGSPLLLLTVTGAQSGLPRVTPLVYMLDGERILLTGSNFGGERHPAWSNNLIAHPDATVTIAGKVFAVTSQVLEGEERSAAYAKFEEAAAPYRAYKGRTDREIRAFSLARR